MKLTDREWKEFKIGDLFVLDEKKHKIPQIPTGACVHKNNLDKGNTPRITVTSMNNGIDNYWTSSHKNYRCYKNFMSVSFLGDCFYHRYKASLDMKVHCLKLKNYELNENMALFLLSCLKNNTKNSSYGNQLSSTDLPAKSILIPINRTGTPDYQFMEDYIKEIIQRKRKEYIEYAKGKLEQNRTEQNRTEQNRTEQNRTEQLVPLHNKKWKEFFVVDIFPSIKRGKRLIKDNQIDGSIPYVSSTAMNNGVDNFIQYNALKMKKYGDCLSVANSGSVGSSFYEPFDYVASDHVTHLKNDQFNKNIYLFIAAMTNRWSQKYNFNREINDTRIAREKVLLPTNDDGDPDYEYMEKCVKTITLQKYQDYLDYTKSNSSYL
jgi:hypothetical protein